MDFTKIRGYLFLGLLAGVSILFAFILKPFAYSIFWAAIIAALFYPVYLKINKYLNHPNLSTVITLSAVVMSIIVPFLIIGTLLVRESIMLYATATGGDRFQQTLDKIVYIIKNNPITAGLNIDESFWAEKFSEAGARLADKVFTTISNITQDSLIFIGLFILMLYSLFYFIRDGEKMLKKLMYLLPLGDRYETMLYKKFTTAASSIIKGTLIVGGIQGFLGGVTFAIAGIEGALIWGIIMILFSIIPGIGSSIIWLPAGIIQILLGNVWQGVFILIVGALLISTIDNILRPILVGKDLAMPPLIILFSTLGGLVLFDASGFIIGPIIAALFLAFWDMYQEYFRKELDNN